MKRTFSFLALFLTSVRCFAAEPVNLKLWEGTPPLDFKTDKPEAYMAPDKGMHPDITRLGNISQANLTVYFPPEGKANGAAVLICPGGGYTILAMKHEGTQVAEWLNSLGFTAIVLKYRVPTPKGMPSHIRPLVDGQRAMSLVRQHAGEWKLDKNRIGVLGFSAGGNLAAWLLTEGNKHPKEYPATPGEAPCRPDFGVLVYPAYLANPKNDRPEPVIREDEKPGPVFFVHADDDKLSSENSVQFYLALKKAGVKSEMHVYQEGGHGFGMLKDGKPVNEWPARCADWLRAFQAPASAAK